MIISDGHGTVYEIIHDTLVMMMVMMMVMRRDELLKPSRQELVHFSPKRRK